MTLPTRPVTGCSTFANGSSAALLAFGTYASGWGCGPCARRSSRPLQKAGTRHWRLRIPCAGAHERAIRTRLGRSTAAGRYQERSPASTSHLRGEPLDEAPTTHSWVPRFARLSAPYRRAVSRLLGVHPWTARVAFPTTGDHDWLSSLPDASLHHATACSGMRPRPDPRHCNFLSRGSIADVTARQAITLHKRAVMRRIERRNRNQ